MIDCACWVLVQVYEPGKGLKFHFDKDEQLLVAEGRMVHPLLSSVLYLTGDAGAAEEPRQGAAACWCGGMHRALCGSQQPEHRCEEGFPIHWLAHHLPAFKVGPW